LPETYFVAVCRARSKNPGLLIATAETIGGGCGTRFAQHHHSVADSRGELFDAVEQFGMRLDGSRAKLFGGPYQILTHHGQCAFDALMIAGLPMGAFAGRLEIPYLNNLAHVIIRIIA